MSEACSTLERSPGAGQSCDTRGYPASKGLTVTKGKRTCCWYVLGLERPQGVIRAGLSRIAIATLAILGTAGCVSRTEFPTSRSSGSGKRLPGVPMLELLSMATTSLPSISMPAFEPISLAICFSLRAASRRHWR